MSGKYDDLPRPVPIQGRKGNLKLWAEMDGAYLGWDSFSLRYGLVDGCGMIPEETEKQHTHDYDQIIWFIGAEPDDMLNLGAEVETDLGSEVIRHRRCAPHAVVIPKGTPHFSPIVRELSRPFFYISVNLTAALKASVADPDAQAESGPWSRFRGEFDDRVIGLTFNVHEPFHYDSKWKQPTGGVTCFLGSETVKLPVTMAWSTIRQDTFTGPRRDDGKHHPHAHADFDEALILLSQDLDNLTELHCTAEYWAGEEGVDQQMFPLTKATVMPMKKGEYHLPLTFKDVKGTCVFITLGMH